MGKWPFTSFVKAQFTALPDVETADLTGRVVIVTGANVGLGYETAVHFSKLSPAKLIIACRNVKAGEEAALKITERNGGKCVPEVWNLDLGSLANVKAFGERAERDLQRLDIVVSNAGINTQKFAVTADGFESTSQVNNIANSLLSVVLLPKLLATAKLPAPFTSETLKPHLVIVASDTHYWVSALPGQKEGRSDILQAFQEEGMFNSQRYPQSKIVNVMNARTIARLVGPSVVVNSVNPGLCYSELAREFKQSWILSAIMTVMYGTLARTTEVGSRNFVWAGLNDTQPGAYVDSCREFEPADLVLSPEGEKMAEGIWREMKVIWKEKVGVDADKVFV